MVEPKLAFYIEQFNIATEEMRQAMDKMDKYKCFALKEHGVNIANNRSYN